MGEKENGQQDADLKRILEQMGWPADDGEWDGEWNNLIQVVRENRAILATLIGFLVGKGTMSQEELGAVYDAAHQALRMWDEIGEFGILRSGGMD